MVPRVQYWRSWPMSTGDPDLLPAARGYDVGCIVMLVKPVLIGNTVSGG